MKTITKLGIVVSLILLCSVVGGHAHQDSIAFWLMQLEQEGVRSEILISLLDLNLIPDLDQDEDGVLDHDELTRGQALIEAQVTEHFLVRNGGQIAVASIEGYEVSQTGEIRLDVWHRFATPPLSVEIESTFFKWTDPLHRVLCKVEHGEQVSQLILDLEHPRQPLDIFAGAGGRWLQLGRFLGLGVEHIFTGYDHVAFLLGLIVLGGSLRHLIGIVSSFTIAHSFTLCLATLGWVQLPDRFVESAIALSICYIAVENVVSKEVSARWVISFFFGLIHGFGFANLLREMQLPPAGLMTSLLSFNLGVEVGQIIILLLAFPLILYITRQSWHKRVVIATSTLIGAFGLFWLVERLLYTQSS